MDTPNTPLHYDTDFGTVFYAEIWVGTPPQRQTVIVDTGSHYTGFPCQNCSDCGNHSFPYFRESLSSTFQQVSCDNCSLVPPSCSDYYATCPVREFYLEGSSWSGPEASDEVTLANSSASFALHFACQTRATKYFRLQVENGIMGLDQSDTSYWKQMYNAGVLKKQQFSLCVGPEPSPVNGATGLHAGIMTFGGSDASFHKTKAVYAALQQDTFFFNVKIKNVFLRSGGGLSVVSTGSKAKTSRVNASLDILNGGGYPTVDIGTASIYLPYQLAAPFDEQWKNVVTPYFDITSGLPQYLTNKELLALPTILFQLEGKNNNDPTAQGLAGSLDKKNPRDVIVAVPPTNYMEYKNGMYKAQIYFDSSSPTLGSPFLMGLDVLYDVDGQRLGMSESSCGIITPATSAPTASKPVNRSPTNGKSGSKKPTSKPTGKPRSKPTRKPTRKPTGAKPTTRKPTKKVGKPGK